jgi:hydrogenase maturation protein HypF
VNEQVIGIAFDGTGYGDDGAVWGGEFLLCDLAGYRRLLHFNYLPLPGGDKAAEEPWRMALSWLSRAVSPGRAVCTAAELCGVSEERAQALLQAAESGIASPLTSSVGRLFDAAAALLGLVQVNGFEAEAPMRMEALAARCYYQHDGGRAPGVGNDWYPFRMSETVSTEEMVEALVDELHAGKPKADIALKFHRTIAEIAAAAAERIRGEHGVNTAALSGGVFQNRILLELTAGRLEEAGFRVLTNSGVPANDGGIALGQIAVAAMQQNG